MPPIWIYLMDPLVRIDFFRRFGSSRGLAWTFACDKHSFGISAPEVYTLFFTHLAATPISNISSFKCVAAVSMNSTKYSPAQSKTITSKLPPAQPLSNTKQPLTLPPTTSRPHKKKGSRNPGKNLTTEEKNSLFEMLDKYHPLSSDKLQGKTIPMAPNLYKSTNFKPDTELGWGSEACFNNAALSLVRDGWLSDDDLLNLSMIDPHYESLATAVLALTKVDFLSLWDERLSYAT